MTTLRDLTINTSALQLPDNIYNQVSTQKCTEWCVAQHFNFEFQGMQFLFVALAFTMLAHFAKYYYAWFQLQWPDGKRIYEFFINHGTMIAGELIIIFILWNLHVQGRITIPFLPR